MQNSAEVLIDLQHGFTENLVLLELALLASCICFREVIKFDHCAV